MAYEVQMPKWGLTMKTGKIARWSVQEGERVEKGKPLLEVETDKITNVVEAPESGVLLKILVAKGQTAAVKSVIAVIGQPGENVDAWEAQRPQGSQRAWHRSGAGCRHGQGRRRHGKGRSGLQGRPGQRPCSPGRRSRRRRALRRRNRPHGGHAPHHCRQHAG